jgi:hypothetical protein
MTYVAKGAVDRFAFNNAGYPLEQIGGFIFTLRICRGILSPRRSLQT